MQTNTRLAFNAYVSQIAKLNCLDASFSAVPGELKSFNVSPVIEQRLQAKLQTTSDFMGRINVVPVVAQQGARVGVGVGRSLAGRTDRAAGKRRTPTDPTASDGIDEYFCKKTDYDYCWSYAQLDAWAHRPEFQQLVRDAVIVQKASDIITIGFNGVDAKAQTDRDAFPLLQDVNWGWLYKMREYAPSRVMDHGSLDTTHVYVDAEGYATMDGQGKRKADYANLDALVFDVVHNLIHEKYRTSTDLVVIVGADLVHDKYFKIISDAADNAMQQVARDVILSSRQLGGKPTFQVPFFPPDAILVTSFKNLSYYWQIGSARRLIRDEPAYDQIDNFESLNEAFMVEEYGKACLIENIQLGAKV